MRSVGQVAKRFGVSAQTVVRWYDCGDLIGVDMSPNIQRSKKRLLRFFDDDLDRFAEKRARQAVIAELMGKHPSSRKK